MGVVNCVAVGVVGIAPGVVGVARDVVGVACEVVGVNEEGVGEGPRRDLPLEQTTSSYSGPNVWMRSTRKRSWTSSLRARSWGRFRNSKLIPGTFSSVIIRPKTRQKHKNYYRK